MVNLAFAACMALAWQPDVLAVDYAGPVCVTTELDPDDVVREYYWVGPTSYDAEPNVDE